MKLTSISANNFKGRSFDYKLAAATAVVGLNFAGKSAITDAIRLALAGWLPECGKTPRATWELSSGPTMNVKAGFDGDLVLTRNFWLEGETVKARMHTNDGKAFEVKWGPEDLEQLPLLNTEAYFAMTDNERTAYVFERIKLPDTYTAAAIVAECERLSFEEAHTEQVENAKAQIIKVARNALIDHRPKDQSFQVSLGVALEDFRTSFTYWNKRAKDTQGAVKTLAELKLREKEVVAAARGVEQEIEKAQKELDRLNTLKGTLTAQQEEASRTAQRKAALRAIIHGDRTDYARLIQKEKKEQVTQEGKLQVELSPAEREKKRRQLKELTDQIARLGATMHEQVKIMDRAEATLSELSQLNACPYCKSTGEKWKENLAAEANSTIKKAHQLHEDSAELRTKFNAQARELDQEWTANEEACEANVKIRLIVRDCASKIEKYEQLKASFDANLAEREEELRVLSLEPAPEHIDADIEETLKAHRAQKEALIVLQHRKEAETRLQQDLRRAAEAELEHQDAAAHVLVIKKIAELLKQKREGMIEEAFADLLTVANKVTRGILKSDLCLHENTVGMWNGGKFVPHRVFSGTERALAYIAIAVALSAQAPLKLVILDEFGRLDDTNQVKVLERLDLCVKDGTIDQFIVVGTSLPETVAVEVIQVK